MARSESQGYQIAVVILGILWVLTSVTAVVFARKYSDAAKQSETDRADAQKALSAVRSAEEDMSKLKQWMGFEPTTSVADVEKTGKADWERYAATLPEAQRTYKASLEATGTALADARENLRIAQEQVQNLKDNNESREQTKDKQIQEFSQQLAQARKDLEAEQAKYDEARKRLEKLNTELAQRIQRTETELTTSREQYDKDMSAADARDKLKTQELKQRDDEIAGLRGETPSVADGQIRQVNPRLGVAFISLGEADYLPRQISFSVYGRDNNGVAKSKRKGALEVTRILGPHYSEARIVETDDKDPILPGDEIYTPLWEPGRPERFALAGFIDVDGDDQSDRELVKELISMNGGILDAELADDGNISGQMSIDTRFLVVGKEKGDNGVKIGQMKATADDLGVEEISLTKFLDHVGWKSTNKTLRFGSDRYRDFRRATPDGGVKTSTGVTSKRFQPRRLGQPKSAFDRPPKAGDRTDATLSRPAAATTDEEPAANEDAPADEAPADEPTSDESAPAEEKAADEAPE